MCNINYMWILQLLYLGGSVEDPKIKNQTLCLLPFAWEVQTFPPGILLQFVMLSFKLYEFATRSLESLLQNCWCVLCPLKHDLWTLHFSLLVNQFWTLFPIPFSIYPCFVVTNHFVKVLCCLVILVRICNAMINWKLPTLKTYVRTAWWLKQECYVVMLCCHECE